MVDTKILKVLLTDQERPDVLSAQSVKHLPLCTALIRRRYAKLKKGTIHGRYRKYRRI